MNRLCADTINLSLIKYVLLKLIMKKKLNYLSFLFFLMTIPILWSMSCSDNPEIDETPSPPPPVVLTPSIKSITPDIGSAGTEVTIIGENFGNNQRDAKITFGTKEGDIFLFSKGKIIVKAPEGEKDGEKVNVTVTIGEKASNTKEFSYITPTPLIMSMSESCYYNSTVIIVGKNFSLIKEDNIVKFGTIEGTVTKATSDSLFVTTPDLGDATSADVTVTRKDMTSNAIKIVVDFDRSKIAAFDWTTHTVKPGVVYKKGELSLFGTAQRSIYILDVTLDASNTLGIGFSMDNATPVAMCKSYDAVAGINAGYFPMSGATALKDPYVRINGITVQDGHPVTSAMFTNSALIIHKNVAKVRKFTEFVTNLNQIAAAIPVSEAENMIVCGPILISNDKIEDQNMSNSHNTSKTARTGLGVTADGKRVFMVVVDSGGGFTGVTTPELAKILQALGAVDAMNFDGGGSSTMFVKEQGDNGRVNFPYGGTTQRKVRSVIYVK